MSKATFTNANLIATTSKVANPDLYTMPGEQTQTWVSRIDDLEVTITFSELKKLAKKNTRAAHQKAGLYIAYCFPPDVIERIETGVFDEPIISQYAIYAGQSSSETPTGGMLKRLNQLINTIQTRPEMSAIEEIMFTEKKVSKSAAAKQHAAGKKFIRELTTFADDFGMTPYEVLDKCLYYRMAVKQEDWVVSPEHHEMVLLTAYKLKRPGVLFNK